MNLREDASSIAILQDVFQTPSELTALKTDLAFLSANFCFLSDIITKLEKSKQLLLAESLKEIDNIENKLNEICGSKAKIIKQKFLLCLNKNKGLQVICKIYILMGNNVEHFEQMEHLSVSDIACNSYLGIEGISV